MPTFADLYQQKVDHLLIAVKMDGVEPGVYEMRRDHLLAILERDKQEQTDFITGQSLPPLDGTLEEITVEYDTDGLIQEPWLVEVWLKDLKPVSKLHDIALR